MNNLILLIKACSIAYYGHHLKDAEILNELTNLVADIPKTKNSLVADDKKSETLLRLLVDWIIAQPKDAPIITSLLNSKVSEILLSNPELARSFEDAFIIMEEKEMRQVIFHYVKEIRKSVGDSQLNFKLKGILRPFLFEGEMDLPKEDWIKLSELLDNKLSEIQGDVDKAVIEEATKTKTDKMVETLDQFKMDLSPEGILKSPFQGINNALGPDFGFRRGLFYLINALTNRGKSFFLAHLLSGFVLYNKPKLRDKSKIPTIFFCSAEDSMGLILRRMFEIFVTAETGERPDFFNYTSQQVVDKIVEVFTRNGWNFAFYRVDPSHDNIIELKNRVRNLELLGHEIIVAAYDYAGMMDLKGTHGESRSDRLQDLIRQMRNFFIARGAVGITPHQLNPKAKELLRENDDESEIRFVREVGGNSMTEGSTKLTNEVDIEMTVHVAKLMNDEAFLTYFIGKIRGEGSAISERYGFYKLEQGTKEKPGRGLVHDINGKPGYRKTLTSALNTSMDLETAL